MVAVAVAVVTALAVPAGAHGAGIGDGSGGVHGDEVRVGVRVITPGSDGSTAYDPHDDNVPSPVRVEVTMQLGNSPGMRVPAACTTPGSPAPNGILYDVTVIDNATGAVLSTSVVCRPFTIPAPGTTTSVVPDPPTIGEIWDAVGIPAPPIGVSPGRQGVVGLPTWLWSGGPQAVQVAVTIRGWTVTGVARVVGYRFETGDAAVVGATGAGSLDAPAATHVYDVKGWYELGAASVWDADVTMTGPGLPAAVPVAIGRAVVGAVRDYQVVEVRSTLVR